MITRASISVIAFFILTSLVWGDTMSSQNFKILQDSLNDASGLSSSTNYRATDTSGELAPGLMQSASYRAFGGFLQLNESFISISLASSTTLTPALQSGVSGVASGTTSVTVITDNPAGYKLEINASGTPALASSSSSINDYSEAVSTIPELWQLATGAAFGFSATGMDVMTNFKNTGSTCGGGTANGLCFLGLKGATKELVSRIYTRTSAVGNTTTIRYKAENKGATISDGSYGATVTLTATPN
ncbi:MAG: hypothetical protein HZA35_03790 [Parcubacteria group bacterium]|nr:hypothetical protein [Parcubacteria group bacterium]